MLVYVFRDLILGWIAVVQIAANDLMRVGDWISVPHFRSELIERAVAELARLELRPTRPR